MMLHKASDIVVVVGSGPSMDVEQARQIQNAGAFIYAVNNAYTLFDEVDLVFAADPAWWRFHHHLVRRHFSGIVMPELYSIENGGHEWGVPNYPSEAGNGWPLRHGKIKRGSNSGFMATQIALSSGAGRVVLVGMDCGSRLGKNHFFGDHPPCMPVPQHYDLWLEDWRALSVAPRPDEKPHVQLWDATPGGVISVFTAIPYVSLDAALLNDPAEELAIQEQIRKCRTSAQQ